jgi:hypothetical protein
MTTQLNYDIYENIALHCDTRTQITLSEVNKVFHEIIRNSGDIWFEIAEYQSNYFNNQYMNSMFLVKSSDEESEEFMNSSDED